MLFRDLDAAVSEKNGDLIDGHARKEEFDSEGIAEHMRETAFSGSIRFCNVGDIEQAPETALPVLRGRPRIPIAGPEKVSWIGLGTGRNRSKAFCYVFG